jgi:ABC-2 type transport system ATP-binding protein
VSVPVSDGVQTLTVAVRKLDDANVHLVDLALRRPSLDDVFLALTGHATGNGDSDNQTDPEEGT